MNLVTLLSCPVDFRVGDNLREGNVGGVIYMLNLVQFLARKESSGLLTPEQASEHEVNIRAALKACPILSIIGWDIASYQNVSMLSHRGLFRDQ